MAAKAAAAAAITYTRLTPELVKPATECIATTFAITSTGGYTDPFSWLFNLRKHHWRSMAGMFVERAAHSGPQLSLVAIDNESGDVAGVMLNEDWKLHAPPAYRSLSSDWRPVRAAFNDLHTRYKRRGPQIMDGEVFHALYFTCTRPESQGKGINKELWRQSMQLAQDHNFKEFVAEASTESTRRALTRLGFQEIAGVPYDEWVFEGQEILSEAAEEKPEEWNRLSIHARKIHSDLWV